ncbi:MAG: hypothetical protein ACOX1S_03605 [Anaerostipes sp.]
MPEKPGTIVGILTDFSDEVAQKGIDLFCSSKLSELLGDGTGNKNAIF